MLGLLEELGPLLIQDDGSLAPNPYAWSNLVDYVFVDQPVYVRNSYNITVFHVLMHRLVVSASRRQTARATVSCCCCAARRASRTRHSLLIIYTTVADEDQMGEDFVCGALFI